MKISKKNRFVCLAVFFFNTALIFSAFTIVLAEEQETPQKICPVMGGKIDKSLFVDHQGNRVYMCCAACVGIFNKDPDKYVKKMSDEGIALEKLSQVKGQCGMADKTIGPEKHKCKGTCCSHKK